MIVKKCDRCGAIIEEERNPLGNNISIWDSDFPNEEQSLVQEWDVCENCIREFKDWMEG